jgi:hypothetical protein
LLVEIIDVPEIAQLPELSGGNEDPAAFADMVLTSFLRCDRAFLYADHESADPPDAPVSWRIHPQLADIVSREFEAGLSPSFASFRASLSYIAKRYMCEASRHGCAEKLLRQGERVRRCLLFLPSTEKAGYWIRAYVSVS